MEEEQVDSVPLAADADTFLSRDKGEAGAQFKQESLEVADERVFEITFAVFVLQVKKFEQIGIAEFVFDGGEIAAVVLRRTFQKSDRMFGVRGPFKELRADLAIELTDGPSAANGF